MGGLLLLGQLHHTKKRMCSVSLCGKHLHWWSNFALLWRVTPTHALGHQNTHIISWAILTNGSKLTATVKVTITRYVDYKRCHGAKPHCLAQWRLRLSDITSRSPCESLTSTNTWLISNTSVWRLSPLWLNSNCANLYTMPHTISTEFVMSLFMLKLMQSRTRYAISFQVDQTFLPFACFYESWEPLLFYFLSTSKGMSQLLCQHWAPEYVWRVSLTQSSYHRPF